MKHDTQHPALKDARDVGACTCSSLRQATRAVTQVYDNALRPAGLKATQFTLLATLAKRGDTALTKLAEALVMDRTTLSRNLQPMIRRQLVRIEGEDDQRIRKVSLTDTGKQAFENALPLWEQIQVQLSEKLGQERWSGFLDDLSATISAIQDR